CWDKNIPIHDNLQALQHNIKEWKFLSFDKVIESKKELMARIGGIQKSMYNGGNLRWLRGLENRLQKELAEILKKEEMMWFQRSRAKWLMDGDRNTRWEWKQTDVTFLILDREIFDMFRMPIEEQEVRKALLSMSPWKAPGPDGYPAGFYQQAWNVVGLSIIDFVRAVWNNPEELNLVNFTNICLIPKVARPEFVNQFRPISLCNTIYKIVSKVMVSRLKKCIPTIVSLFQTGFVPGLPHPMINVIMKGVTSVQTIVKWNGICADYFRPTRGIRQGDPISPYLFVMGMDKLSHLICHAVNQGEWKPIKVGRNGPVISHLMFADDLLLFGQAKVLQMQCVMRILDEFCTLSGQHGGWFVREIPWSSIDRTSAQKS
ncbi:hypothetical protein A2U01_0003975, partial [Trifolium medium]|nr:hypothetical protein [Trifolium medium]